MSKRKRDPTFNNSEKTVLLDLVKEHFNIIECKKTDVITQKNKQEDWVKIAEEFNAMSIIHPRDPTVLKNCWENLKKKAKQANTLRNQNFLGTGGGPNNDKEDPILEKVLELIKVRVSGFVNIFDSDGINVLGSTLQSQADQEGYEVSVDVETMNTNWSEYTPTMLREPRSAALSTATEPEIDQQELINEPRPSTSTSATSSAPVILQQDYEAASTPPRTETRGRRPLLPSRRRPIISQSNSSRGAESLNSERVATLLQCNKEASEEHDIKMKILKLQEEREKEILQQEKLKTLQEELKVEILKLEIKKIKDSL